MEHERERVLRKTYIQRNEVDDGNDTRLVRSGGL